MTGRAYNFPSTKICFAFVLIIACSFFAHAQTPTPTPTPQPSPTSKDTPAPTVTSNQTPSDGGLEILSDTKGVDFRPYMKRLRYTVHNHWYPLIPEVAMPPILKSGTTIIDLVIGKDGRILKMKIEKSSGDDSLDKAAWGAITTAVPLPLLPAEFSGDNLRVRARFAYNPAKAPGLKPNDDPTAKPDGATK